MSDVQRQVAVLFARKAFDDPGGFFPGQPLGIVFAKASAVVRDAFAPPSVPAFAKPDRVARLGKPCAILDGLLDGGKDFAFPGFGYFSLPNISEVFF